MTRNLTALFDPASVAIVGASDDPVKWGYAVARQALRGADRRPVHLVNRRGGTVLGRTAATSLDAIGDLVDLVVIAVPAASLEATVDDALALGARAIVAITAGFAELGDDGSVRQRAIAARVAAAGAVLVGPNCLGLVDNTTRLYLSSDPFTDGRVALLSQSGNLALELEQRLARHDLGFSRFVSVGNQADVTLADLVDDCARHEGTTAIAVYAEDFADGRGFAAAAAEATRVGKPIVLLTTGAGEASARGARSHTGAMTSPADVVAAVCRDAGVRLVRTPREMVASLASLASGRRTPGRRVAVLTDGGGHGSIAADVLERAGLRVPALSPTARAALGDVLWSQSALGNPVDLAGMGEQDPMAYANAIGTLLAADDIDAVLMTGFFGGYAATGGDATGTTGDETSGDQTTGTGMGGGVLGDAETKAGVEIARLVTVSGKPVVVQSMYPTSPSCTPISAGATPVFGAIEDAVAALGAVSGVRAPRGFVDLPRSDPPVADVGYFGVRRLLNGAGVAFPAAAEVHDRSELWAAAAAMSGPYVLKAVHLLHKSDAGGVVVGLADADALVSAFEAMHERLHAPAYSVEAMADAADGLELIVGVRVDPRFGPVAMVGIGGVHAEVLHDVAFALAPVTDAHAVDLLRGLRSAALLDGARGRTGVDVPAAAAAIASITALAAAHPEIAELEVNPLLATPSGAVALDARAVLTAADPRRSVPIDSVPTDEATRK